MATWGWESLTRAVTEKHGDKSTMAPQTLCNSQRQMREASQEAGKRQGMVVTAGRGLRLTGGWAGAEVPVAAIIKSHAFEVTSWVGKKTLQLLSNAKTVCSGNMMHGATGKGSPHPLPRNLLFATDRHHCRKPQPIKMQNCTAQPQWIHCKTTASNSLLLPPPHIHLRLGNISKEGRDECTSQRTESLL